jgi:hypothetical protein
MKYLFLSLVTFIALTGFSQEDKSKRPSPPASVSETLKNGTVVSIDYSQPSLKGRTIGDQVAPFGEVWRTGANEATVFQVSKDVKLEGQPLPAGKYSLYSIPGENEWTIIINKTWDQWGTVYNESEDVLRAKVKPAKKGEAVEKMTFKISKDGKVSLLWGEVEVSFNVQ